MKILLCFLLLFFPMFYQAQVVYDKTEYNFEEIGENDDRFVDVYLKNTSNEDIYILSVNPPMEVDYIQENALIQPDSSAAIRFQIRKRTRGRFDYSIPVFTSNSKTSTSISLKGKITASASNNLTACPTFGEKPAEGNPLDFLLTVETIDKATGEKLGKSKVAILQNGNVLGQWPTKRNGQLKIKLPLGISYFYATHKGYYPREEAHYVNFKNNHITLALRQKEEAEIPEEAVPKKPDLIVDQSKKPEKEPIKQEEEERVIVIDEDSSKALDLEIDLGETSKESAKKDKESITENPLLEELDKDNFDSEHFKPVNVVFVVDVSYSMNRYERAELMKYALDQLLKMLRPEDKIGVVSYASDAKVILASTSGSKKKEIAEAVDKLKISGSTAGGKGIRLGYKQVRKNKIKEGRNHLIIITDGAFNRGSGRYKKHITKNLEKRNITMSVVAIKSKEKAEESMREAAALGDGRFVLIKKLADAQEKLRQEIRVSAFRY